MITQPLAGTFRVFLSFAAGCAIMVAVAISPSTPSAAYNLADANASSVQNNRAADASTNGTSAAAPAVHAPNQVTAPPDPGAPGDTLSASVSVLVRLFVLAVILESALAVIFTWRPYAANFETRTTNPLIMFIAAFALVSVFNLDEVGSLIGAYGSSRTGSRSDDQWTSIILTALVVAGGSAGVNRMLRALGYRSITLDEEQPRPPRTEAWMAVIDTSRAVAEGSYDILTRADSGTWAVVGSLKRARRRSPLIQWLLRDPRRFPTSGGLSMPVNTRIEIAIQSQGSSTPISVWGPNALAAGAIIDIPVDLAGPPVSS